MTQDEIIRMAREAGLEIGVEFIAGHKTNIERFAALVAAHEREACAKVCEQLGALNTATPQKIAASIRVKGEK